MFKKVNSIDSCDVFLDIYNSAILNFAEEERGEATSDIFYQQISTDINYIYYDNDDFPKAFFSYKKHTDYLFQLTSLYVRKECQRMGIGKQSILFLEEMIPTGSVLCVKVLKNAPWSINFYYKMGFMDISNEMEKEISEYGLKTNPWSRILRKNL